MNIDNLTCLICSAAYSQAMKVQSMITARPRRTALGSSAQRVIDLLVRRGPLTIAQLVAELGVTTTAVRQQVNRLSADGWITRTQRRRGPGRPADVFAISEEARRRFGTNLGELSRLLIEEIVDAEGPARGRVLLRRVGRRIAENRRSAVGEGPPSDRLRRLAELLSRDGMMVAAEQSGDDLKLTVFTCPFRGLATEHPEVCDMEREAFSALLGGPVQLRQCAQSGYARCEFGVSAEPPAPEPQA